MTKPNDTQEGDFRATLPADLQDLDRELSGIRIEERPSFGPELEGELSRAWKARQASRPEARPSWKRALLAAGLAGLMIAGVSVPSARAAVFQLVRTVAEEAFPSLFAPEQEAEVLLPEIEVQEPAPIPEESPAAVVVSPADVSEEVETSQPVFQTIPEVVTTLPEIVSRPEAARIIAEFYPVELREAGVEGSVKLLFWVNEEGSAESVQWSGGSGNLDLQGAATRAVREIQFRPATRNGVPVGTWVEVDVHFFAITGAGMIGTDTMDAGR
jgi:TonB family protein